MIKYILLLFSFFYINLCINAQRITVNKFRHYIMNTTTNVSVGYSTRRLNVTYTGFALKVRRSSDNTTLDIGFTSTGELDTATLKTFVGANNGFVTTWYDQGPNAYHVTQTTNSQQPKIVNAGVIYRNPAGRPYILFTTTSSTVLSNTSISASSVFTSGYIGTVYLVTQAAAGTTSIFGFSDGGSNRWQSHLNESGNLYFDVGNGYNRISYGNSANQGVWQQYSLDARAASMTVRIKGVQVASGTSASACTATTWYIGGIPPFPGTWYHNGGIAELIVVKNSTPINPLMENNQISYWGL
jgi:hypothetical protein